MHQVKTIAISNFRSCRKVQFSLSDCTPIVGYNNAGKSNLLDAIEWFVAPKPLLESDFHDTEAPVAMEGIIAGLDEAQLAGLADKHRTKIERYITDGELLFRRIQPFPGARKAEITLEVRDPTKPVTVQIWKTPVRRFRTSFQPLEPDGSKKPAAVLREWAARPDAGPVTEALYQKLWVHDIWLWTGGDIEHHLGLTGPKDLSTWAPFRARLAVEGVADVIQDSDTVTALVDWLGQNRRPI